MGWNKKVKFWPNERLDLPDLIKMQKNVYDYSGQEHQKFLSATKSIISGFIVLPNGGLNIKVSVKDSVALCSENETDNITGLMWIGSGDISIDADLTAVLANNTLNYIELGFFEEDSAPDTRALWDMSANNGVGDEFNQIVNTCTTIKTKLIVSTTGFTGSTDTIPLARVLTASGAVTVVEDYRPLHFRLSQPFTWSGGRVPPTATEWSKGDKVIKTQKEWQDAVMSILAEIKGTAWYENIGTGGPSLEDIATDRNTILAVTGGIEFNSDVGQLTWNADIQIMVPTENFDYRIPAGSMTAISDEDVLYVVFDRTGVITTPALLKVQNGLLELNGNVYAIGFRKGKDFILRDGRVVTRVWTYEESIFTEADILPGDAITLPVDSRNSNSARVYKNGRAEIDFLINGLPQNRSKVVLVSGIVPLNYETLTGIVDLPLSVDLSRVYKGCLFIDSALNELVIHGIIEDTPTSKKILVNAGETVSLDPSALIVTQDFAENGLPGSWVGQITAKKFIPANSILTFRIIPLSSLGGGSSGSGGGGGGGSLQDAYNTGRTVITTAGNPLEISGPAGQKLLKVNGDADISGVVDPKGVTLTPQSTNPAVGKNTFWLKNTGILTFSNTLTGKEEVLGGGESVLTGKYLNNQTRQLLKGSVIRKFDADSIIEANNSDEDHAAVIGILLDNVDPEMECDFLRSGRVPDGTFTADNFVEGVLPAEGKWIYLSNEDGKMTITPPAMGSQLIEMYLGNWDKGSLNLNIVPWGRA